MDPGVTELECQTIVFRVITRASDLDHTTQRPKPSLFHRRQADQDGLSVNYNCMPSEAGASLRGRRAIASLHVGRVRSLQLDVIPDTHDHANITGVPIRGEDAKEIERAEQLAADLAEQARIAHRF
jgi:hypothetical protein